MKEATVTHLDNEELETPLSSSNAAICRVADQMHRLNHAIVQAVEAGVTIELLRCSRYHAGNGLWGDQMQPIVTVKDADK